MPGAAETARLRLVSYQLHPFRTERLTLGVVVELSDGRLHVMPSPHTPSAESIGTKSRAGFLFARELLDQLTQFDRLPAVCGPQVLLSPAISIHADDPLAFAAERAFTVEAANDPGR